MGESLVSVFVPTRDNVGELLLCLESLRRLQFAKERLELVIFDNGSTDETAERVGEMYGRLKAEGWARLVLERSPRNLGAFGGRAEALRLLGDEAEFVLSLDDDVEVEPDALSLLLAAMTEARAGIVGARIVYEDAPEEVASAAGYINRWLGTYSERRPAGRATCDFVSSCGCLIRREAFEAAEGFDRDFFTSHGDVDLCLKVRAQGHEVVYEPSAVIRHKVSRGGTRTPERVYYGYRNKLLLLRKHLPRWWRPAVFALYGGLWLPRILLGSLAHHRGLCRGEVRAILLAALDAALDRRGESRWVLSR